MIRIPLFILAVLLFFSCNKESPNTTQKSEKLLIQVAGIIDESPAIIALKSSGSNHSTKRLHVSKSVVNRDLSEVTLQLSSIEEHTNHSPRNQTDIQIEDATVINLAGAPVLPNGTKKIVAQSSPSSNIIDMGSGISFRLILYTKKGDNLQFQQSLDLKSGTKTEIDIIKGQQYQWYAYSCNTEENLTPLNNSLNPAIPSSFNSELLYDSGTFNLQNGGGHHLLIKFKQQLARIGLRINSKGIFGNISAIKVQHSSEIPLISSSFNLIEGRFTNTVSSISKKSGDAIALMTDPTNPEIMEAYYYTSAPATLPTSFQVSISKLVARYEDNSTEILIGENGKNTAAQQLTFGGFRPAIGKSSVGNINLIHGGINLGGVIWAKGNLNYENGVYKIRPSGLFTYFRSNNENSANFMRNFGNTDYWFWMSATPNATRNDWTLNKVDPCNRVFPTGTWHMPKNADFAVLTDRSNNRKTDFRVVIPYAANSMYAEFFTRGKPYNDPTTEKLIFKADGRFNQANNSIAYDTYILFWSSTENTSFLAYGGRIAYYFRLNNNYPEISTLFTNLNSRRYNIRCVRNLEQ